MTASLNAVPTANWVEPDSMLEDPYPTYRRLVDSTPVAWVPSIGRYLVTSAAACRAVEEDQDTFSANVSGSAATLARALGAPPMLRKDDPEHAIERRAVNPALRPKALRAQWEPVFARNSRIYLDALQDRGPDEADLNRDYAGPVAAQNLIDLLGLKGAGVADMQRWSHAFIAGTGNLHDDPDTWTRCDDARNEVDGLLHELVGRYRTHPDATITSALVAAGLPLAEIGANVKLTIAGGMNEPQHVVTAAVWALSQHPDQLVRVFADPDLWPAVFEETTRWLAPIGMYPRETTRPVTLAGVPLPAGAPIGVVVAAANRDPAVFDGPDAFDIVRPRQPHLAFGSGVHLCAGHWAARISIGETALPQLYAHLPGLRADPRRAAEWNGWVFRGLTTLPVTWNS
ncbi:cytochrome P450 [Rhodococcus fascians]|nr:cytochrome P450 [Rhodococcus fascians]MBY4239441.1 cytochrome P450 [Rhodococcus fascians]MBY4254976.1 cytochrome P450 [Rhodococcus fascians]MBY4270797.1 cytochrome P450 [Rhodococcus fascians]